MNLSNHSTAESFTMQVDSNCNLRVWEYTSPPVLALLTRYVEDTLHTNVTRVVGCVAYRPVVSMNLTLLDTFLPMIYVVRCRTALCMDSGNVTTTRIETNIQYCDVTIYSNPLLRIFTTIDYSVRGEMDPLHLIALPATHIDALLVFVREGARAAYSAYKFHTGWFKVDMVQRNDQTNEGGMMSNSQPLSRYVWDMVTAFPITRDMLEAICPFAIERSSDSTYPTVYPLCFALGLGNGHIYIVRYIETLTNLYYDMQFRVAPFNSVVEVTRCNNVPNPYSAFCINVGYMGAPTS